MLNEIKRLILFGIITFVILIIFLNTIYGIIPKNVTNSNLVVYGDNIKSSYAPFIENGGVYISVDTISKVIDEYIYYDKVSTKVIITTYSDVIKFKVDENKMSKNLNYLDIQTPARMVDSQVYIDINLLKDIYQINVEYNEITNTISIDKKNTSDINITHNKVFVYEDLSTKSQVLQILNTNNTVVVYTDSLNHNRWYKVKTDSGVVGYIAKNNIDLVQLEEKLNANEDNESNENTDNIQEKMTMFWQYGSDLNVMGKEKVIGVGVVSPTWYELKSSSGEITSKFSRDYYNQAKSHGYKIWPIITNGIDSVSYSPSDTSAMLNSEYNREQFIKNLLQICKSHGLDGINIDFEAMKTEDREIYTQFIRELVPILRSENIIVSVDMYFVAYIDRKEVGKAADYIVLMGYDQRGSWSTEAGSIAEVNWVEKNINSLINDSKIPSQKIILGVPFYTRLWTIVSGEEKPKTNVYTMKDCQTFLSDNGITTIWDEDAGQNYAELKKGDTTYKLWIEDKDSIKKRVETVNKYNLAGITGWRKGFETNDIWNVINENLK